ncbi:MAG: DUF5723 family protein [Prevotellaceae bacterium]|jgi:hypothetical protein|nr:DUF5723 family protein [Prevotellaceae bacterium]
MRQGIKRIAYHIFTLIIAVLMATTKLCAQQDQTLYFMQGLPLVSTVNPAYQPEHGSVYVGFPVLSSIYINAGTSIKGVSYNSVSKGSPDLSKIVNSSGSYESAGFNFTANIFNFGYLYKDMYFTLDMSVKANADARAPKDVLKLAWYGNAPTIGQPTSLSGLGSKADTYLEVALGFSKEVVRDKILIGGKIKRLMGLAHAAGELGNGSFINTDPETWAITAGVNPKLNVAGLPLQFPSGAFEFDTANVEMGDYAFGFAGGGWAIDAGFQINFERWVLSGSILDLGGIKWRNGQSIAPVNGYITGTFDGLDKSTSSDATDKKNENIIIDSLLKNARFIAKKESFTSWFSPKITLAATYEINKHLDVGALLGLAVNQYNTVPLVTAAVTSKNYPVNGTLTYSYSSHNNSIGVGLLVGRKGTQMHLICDNVLAADYKNARHTSVRFGFNFLFGKPRDAHPKPKKLGPMNTIEDSPRPTVVDKRPLRQQ